TNLAELIQTRGLTADQTIEVLRPIASARETAHAAGLVHRDVKRQNVLITSHGHPDLADFGVAKGSNTYGRTATGGSIGSVNYASPEQIKGLTLTAASDVYALTAVLFQCLTGRVPYERESDAAVMHAHLTEPPPTLAAVAGADSDFHTVFARGMAKDPGARYGHAGDLINAAGLSVGRLPSVVRKAVPAFRVQDALGSASAKGRAGGDRTEFVTPEQAARMRSAESHTTADRKRPAVAEPEPAVASSARRWRPVAGGVAGVAIAIAAIVLAMTGSGASAPVTIVRRGFIQLAYSKPWHALAPPKVPVQGLRFSTPIALERPGATLIAGGLRNGAPIPGALPDALREHLSATPHGTTVGLGATAAVAYSASARGAGQVGIWVIPTANGDLGVLCEANHQGGIDSCLQVA